MDEATVAATSRYLLDEVWRLKIINLLENYPENYRSSSSHHERGR